MQTAEKKKFEYKYVIVAACFVMVLICLGFCSSNKGLYLSAITEALGIKRSLFSLNDTCRYVTTAVVNLFFGYLVNRFGTRKMVAAGFLCLIISTTLYAVAENIFVFYLGGCFLGLGLSWTTTTMVGCIVKRWYKEKAGTIMGLVLCANGIGGAVAAQIVSPIIYEEGNAFGYRNAYYLIIAILAVVGVIVVSLMREVPNAAPIPLKKERKNKGKNWSGIDSKTAFTKKYFYLTLLSVFLTGFMLQSITGISSACMKDFGLDANYIATVLSIHSLSLAAFKFLTGFLYDRFGLRFVITVCDIAAVLTNLLLSLVTNSPVGMVLAMIYGIISSLALPLETIMIPLIVGDFFGNKSFDQLLGLSISVCTAGFALGSPIVNMVYDVIGSYRPMLYIFTVIMLLVSVLMQFIISRANKEREAICAAEAAQAENTPA